MRTLKDNLDTIEEIRGLEKNWNGYGADPLSNLICDKTKGIVENLREYDQPYVVPTANGTIQLEWNFDFDEDGVRFKPRTFKQDIIKFSNWDTPKEERDMYKYTEVDVETEVNESSLLNVYISGTTPQGVFEDDLLNTHHSFKCFCLRINSNDLKIVSKTLEQLLIQIEKVSGDMSEIEQFCIDMYGKENVIYGEDL